MPESGQLAGPVESGQLAGPAESRQLVGPSTGGIGGGMSYQNIYLAIGKLLHSNYTKFRKMTIL